MRVFVWQLRAQRVSSWRFWRAEWIGRLGLAARLLLVGLAALAVTAIVVGLLVALL